MLTLDAQYLTRTQRAMTAARMATVTMGGDRRSATARRIGLLTAAQAAGMVGVSTTLVVRGKLVLRYGTPDDIAGCDAGLKSVSATAFAIRARQLP